MTTATVFLVTSDSSLKGAVRGVIESLGQCRLEAFSEALEVIPHIQRVDASLLLIHQVDEGQKPDVIRLLHEISSRKKPMPTLVLSETEDPRQTLRLLRHGVADCLCRPLDLTRLRFLIDTLTIRARFGEVLAPEASDLCSVRSLGERDPFLYLTPEMQRIIEQVHLLAPQDTTILLTGETGTGKTRLARLIHELSPRREAPFIVLNCAALSASLIESELFGHVKGAFTGADNDRVGKFADAGSGTLLLDDIDALPSGLQAKLLRAVDEHVFEPVGSNKSLPIRARLLAACNRCLEAEVEAGRFRADLYYRINVVSFHLPPLRERRVAVRALAEKFISEIGNRSGLHGKVLSADAIQAFQSYDWPGNIRELRNAIERAVTLCKGSQIRTEDLPDAIRDFIAETQGKTPPSLFERASMLSQTRIQAEIGRILQVLEKHSNNRLQAAHELGISRMTLYRKLHRYGLI